MFQRVQTCFIGMYHAGVDGDRTAPLSLSVSVSVMETMTCGQYLDALTSIELCNDGVSGDRGGDVVAADCFENALSASLIWSR